MFDTLERLCKKGAYGYICIPTEHPSGQASDYDTRHFTCLTAQEQKVFLKKRNWKIVSKGVLDDFSKTGIWHWYIVQLP